jgi:Heavy metal associated domain 2
MSSSRQSLADQCKLHKLTILSTSQPRLHPKPDPKSLRGGRHLQPKLLLPAKNLKPNLDSPPPKFVVESKSPGAPPAAASPPAKFGIHIVHRVPGRTRVELRQMKQNDAIAKKVEERLLVVPGILAVETSTITGRAVIYYNPKVIGQPSALQDLQQAWQDLYPGMQTEKLVAFMTSQKQL